MKINYKLLDKDLATAPTRAYDGDAGIDLYASRDIKILGRSTKRVHTDIAFEIPKGYYGQIFDRSGLGGRAEIFVKCGVIDSGYRGEVLVTFGNNSNYPYQIKKGDKIAQMVILPVPEFELARVSNLKKSEREDKGFGSTDTP
jgi:dUTP pyrophosphatase